MVASGSSSSAESLPERPSADLGRAGLLPALPAAFLGGEDLDLLAPLGFRRSPGSPGAAGSRPDRGELAAALAAANASYGHPDAEGLAARLADPATRVVVTGQQPGLFGGPLYTLSKAVAAALWARRLEEAGEPAVAVFWVATEDHDFREVARGAVFTPEGPLSLDLGDDPAPLMPVGMRTLGPGVQAILERLRAAVPGERYAEWLETLGGWYRPDARFGEAFCKLLAGLLGDRCPLLLDSMLPAVKAAERPWLGLIVERRDAIEAAFAERNERIAARGHELKVAPQPGASPLFFLHGQERRRVEWLGGGRLALRGAELEEDVDWLLAAIDENPGAVSPGVMARGAVQDAILGTSVQVLGAGELAYAPQVAPLYEVLELPAPSVALRPQTVVLGAHQLGRLDELALGLGRLVAPELDLDKALAGGRELDLVGPTSARIGDELESLRAAATALDPQLEGPWGKTRGQVQRALEIFTDRVAASVARRNEVARRRAEDLRATCRPLGAPQERVISSAHFPGKYGPRLVEAYFEQLDLDPASLQVICP